MNVFFLYFYRNSNVFFILITPMGNGWVFLGFVRTPFPLKTSEVQFLKDMIFVELKLLMSIFG